MKRVILILMIALFSVVMVSAQGVDDDGNPNDPNLNDNANACYEGGSMAGRCETELDWVAGWYLIRYEFGLNVDVPDWVEWVLPNGPVILQAGCYTMPLWNEDIYYNGNENMANNSIVAYSTSDGTCSGYTHTHLLVDYIFFANSMGAAQTVCKLRFLTHITGDMYYCHDTT